MRAPVWLKAQSVPTATRALGDARRRREASFTLSLVLSLAGGVGAMSCAAVPPAPPPATPQSAPARRAPGEQAAAEPAPSTEPVGNGSPRDAAARLTGGAHSDDEPPSAHPTKPKARVQGQAALLELDDLPPPVLWTAPAGAKARPLIVSAHGAGGTPEWHCSWLTRAVGTQAHVLCLRGHAISRGADAYYYPEHHTLERLFLRGTEAAVAALAPDTAEQGHIYVGYSQGATMGALMIVAHAERFPNLLLIEGGHSHWTRKRSREFATRGGQRVYFACGQSSCKRAADRSSQHLGAAGIEVRVGYAPGAGHTPAGEVGELATEGLQWLLSTQ